MLAGRSNHRRKTIHWTQAPSWALIAMVLLILFLFFVPTCLLFAEGIWTQRGKMLLQDLHQGHVIIMMQN